MKRINESKSEHEHSLGDSGDKKFDKGINLRDTSAESKSYSPKSNNSFEKTDNLNMEFDKIKLKDSKDKSSENQRSSKGS